jgi:hypothetical protein
MGSKRRARPEDGSLEKLIEEATVDAYGPAEQATGFLTMIEEHVGFPFKARVIGEEVEVTSVDVTEDGEDLVAKCRRRGRPYKVLLTEVRIPGEVRGKEWIAAYFQFLGKNL